MSDWIIKATGVSSAQFNRKDDTARGHLYGHHYRMADDKPVPAPEPAKKVTTRKPAAEKPPVVPPVAPVTPADTAPVVYTKHMLCQMSKDDLVATAAALGIVDVAAKKERLVELVLEKQTPKA